MTRRIALALVLLTAAVLIAAVVPLALGAIDHERDAFVQDTAGTASSIALLARGPLQTDGHEDHADFAALSEAMQDAERDSDQVAGAEPSGAIGCPGSRTARRRTASTRSSGRGGQPAEPHHPS